MIALFRRFVPFALVALAACDSSPTTGPAPNSGGPAPVSGGRAEILFHRKVGSFSQIFAMPADGSAVVQLTASN